MSDLKTALGEQDQASSVTQATSPGVSKDDANLATGLESLSLGSTEKSADAAVVEKSENFCEACQRLFRNEIEVAKPCSFTSPYERQPSKDEFHVVEEYFVHHRDGGCALRDAASRGCALCRHVYLSMSKIERETICQDHSKTGFAASDFMTRYKFRFHVSESTFSKYCTMEYHVRTFDESVVANTGRRYISLGTPVEKHFHIMPCVDFLEIRLRKPDLSICSDSCIEQIQNWLKVCDTEHGCTGDASSRSREATEFPTRLVDVGTTSSPHLQVRECKDIAGAPPYTTLSHSWGKAKFFTLIASNIAQLKAEIPLEKLPKTHQEAIHLTRSLGIQYIWIDSLCIIQDSEQDWASESARMMAIYSNSHCNIAATAAADGSRGLFFQRDDADIDPVIFKLPDRDGRPGSLRDNDGIELVRSVFQSMKYTSRGKEYTPGKFDTFYFTDADVWATGVPQSPLGKRAWCLQERVLAPRTVHFGEKQLLFQCQSLHACSRFPDGIPPILIPAEETHASLSLRNAVQQASRPDDPRAIERAYQIWKNLVTTYSSCDLTYERDKLVAISGMASYMGKHFQLSSYLAGVWSYRALDQLLWQRVPDPSQDAPPRERPKTYQAPSWSWACVNYPVKFTAPRYPLLAKTQDGLVARKDPQHEYGEVNFGALVLRGELIATTVYERLKPIGASRAEYQTQLRLGATEAYVEPAFDSWLDGRPQGKFVCAPLAFTNPHKGVVGLVLVETEVNEIGGLPPQLRKYRRAGFFEMSKYVWGQYRGRPVKLPYTLERGHDGKMVQRWSNGLEDEPDFEDADRDWFQKNAVDYLVV